MLTADGPRVVEFNCRFGDPECQAILPRLDQDLLPLLEAVATGRGLPGAVRWRGEASVCVVLASGGYPGKYQTGLPISGLDGGFGLGDESLEEVNAFHAGTALRDGRLVTAGGRVLGVQARGADIRSAIDLAYRAVARIRFDGMHFRKDIGRKALAR
jgi:phosphoribosylamine--glycine ligase